MKTRKLALLLPLLPLLMANSPARSIYSARYEDFDASYVGEEIIDNYRYQVFRVNNIGDGFISSFYANGKLDYEFSASARSDEFYPIFEDVVIGPNQETEIKIKSNTPLVVVDGDKLEYYSYAYFTKVEGVTVSGTKGVELLKETDTYCYYSIDVKVENAPSNEAISVVFKANYDGHEFYLKTDSYERYRFYTTEPIDLTKLEIGDSVAVLKDTVNNYDYDYDVLVVFREVLLRLLLVFIIIIFIVGNIIFLSVFLPKIIRKSKQRKREQEKKQNSEENKRE